MDVVVLFLAIVFVVAAGAFLSGRRFGILAVGLAVGSVLSELWASELAKLVASFGVATPLLPVGVWSAVGLLLLPVVLLLMSGPRQQNKMWRLASAVGVGLLAAAFLVVPLGRFMTLEGDVLQVYQILKSYWTYVVTIGLVIGVADVFMTHSGGHTHTPKKH